VFIILLWRRDARLATWDREWFRRVGGYLGFQGKVPAGKLNAGQKSYFWFVASAGTGLVLTGMLMFWPDMLPGWLSVAYTLHDLLAILFFCGVIVHFYLAVVANPGSLQGIIDGTVSASWAREHHPLWLKDAEASVKDRGNGKQPDPEK
jgi:formate dehydrogenase subunit gamma